MLRARPAVVTRSRPLARLAAVLRLMLYLLQLSTAASGGLNNSMNDPAAPGSYWRRRLHSSASRGLDAAADSKYIAACTRCADPSATNAGTARSCAYPSCVRLRAFYGVSSEAKCLVLTVDRPEPVVVRAGQSLILKGVCSLAGRRPRVGLVTVHKGARVVVVTGVQVSGWTSQRAANGAALGAFRISGGVVTVTDCDVYNNTMKLLKPGDWNTTKGALNGTQSAGGFCIDGGTVTIERTNVSQNVLIATLAGVNGFGGGFNIGGTANVTIAHTNVGKNAVKNTYATKVAWTYLYSVLGRKTPPQCYLFVVPKHRAPAAHLHFT